MKIPFEDGIVDTDHLTDKEAAISEAIANLHKICQQFNVTSFTRVVLDNRKFMGQTTVIKGTDMQIQQDFDCLMLDINQFVTKVTNGQVVLMRAKP